MNVYQSIKRTKLNDREGINIVIVSRKTLSLVRQLSN